jgi:UDP-2,3-diacylglucosamine hydrolase
VTRALFISDLHLAGERPQTTRQFFDFLRGEAARAQALYVLGDLFEYWVGDDELQAAGADPLAADVAQGFRRLTDSGVPAWFMHGNRDFLVASGFLAASGMRFLEDPSVVEVGGERVALLHGDTLCTDDRAYQEWRRTARSSAFQDDFLAKPLAERHRVVGGMREKSKAVTAATAMEIMDVNPDAVRDVFRRLDVRRMVHGHTHRPALHELEIDGKRCERWVLPDWYGRGGYLAWDDVGPRLVSF